MDVAAFILALIAVAISLRSLRLARRADRREDRAAERGERKEEREIAEATARRRGHPIVTPRGGSGGPTADPVTHGFVVRNGGQATITELGLWIVDGEGRTVSNLAGGALALAPGDPPARMAVEVRQPLPLEQTLMVRWRDQDGEHTVSTGIRPRRHM